MYIFLEVSIACCKTYKNLLSTSRRSNMHVYKYYHFFDNACEFLHLCLVASGMTSSPSVCSSSTKYPSGVALYNGSLYVVCISDKHLAIFNATTLTFLKKITLPFNLPNSMAIYSNSSDVTVLYILNYMTDVWITNITATGISQSTVWTRINYSQRGLILCNRMSLTSYGQILMVSSPLKTSIYVFDLHLNMLSSIEPQNVPELIEVVATSYGTFLVLVKNSSMLNFWLCEISANGTVIRQCVNSGGSGLMAHLAIDSHGLIYVTHWNGNIQIFLANFTVGPLFSLNGGAPTAISFDPKSGMLAVGVESATVLNVKVIKVQNTDGF